MKECKMSKSEDILKDQALLSEKEAEDGKVILSISRSYINSQLFGKKIPLKIHLKFL
jgi:hypothetical protein